MNKLILASASPRRKELLTQLGTEFTVQSADIDESPYGGESPNQYVERMAREKSHTVYVLNTSESLVLGSDTTVVYQQQILGKPNNQENAIEMLMLLSGHWHTVLTSVALSGPHGCRCVTVEAQVKFATLDEQQCVSYWKTGEPQDKAGSYGIQGIGGRFVEQIQGSYSAIVGLPLAQTADLLTEFKVPIWQFN